MVERLNDVSYVLKCDKWRNNKVVHVDKIKLVKVFES